MNNVTQRCINVLWADKETFETVCKNAASEIDALKRADDLDEDDTLYLEELVRNYETGLAQLQYINAQIPVLMTA
jgi:hypothetical protein